MRVGRKGEGLAGERGVWGGGGSDREGGRRKGWEACCVERMLVHPNCQPAHLIHGEQLAAPMQHACAGGKQFTMVLPSAPGLMQS